MLLDLYQSCKDKMEIKKRLWQFIADKLSSDIPEITAENCQKRCIFADRNYKKYTKNKTATCREGDILNILKKWTEFMRKSP